MSPSIRAIACKAALLAAVTFARSSNAAKGGTIEATGDGNILVRPGSPHTKDGVPGVNVVGRLYATDKDESSNTDQEIPIGSVDVVNEIKAVKRRTDSLEDSVSTLVGLVRDLVASQNSATTAQEAATAKVVLMSEQLKAATESQNSATTAQEAATAKVVLMTEQLKTATESNAKDLGGLVSQLSNVSEGSSGRGGGEALGGEINTIPSLWGGAPPWTGDNLGARNQVIITALRTDAEETMWKSFFGTQKYYYGRIAATGKAVEADRLNRVLENLEHVHGAYHSNEAVLQFRGISGATLELKNLKSVQNDEASRAIYFYGNAELKTVLLPALETVSTGSSGGPGDDNFVFYGNPLLDTITINPAIGYVSGFSVQFSTQPAFTDCTQLNHVKQVTESWPTSSYYKCT